MRTRLIALVLVGCATDIDDEQACEEVGFAISARFEECTGDAKSAAALFEQFEDQTRCKIADLPPDTRLILDPVLPYECALVTRNLACELVLDYGDDLSRWLASSPTCRALLEGP